MIAPVRGWETWLRRRSVEAVVTALSPRLLGMSQRAPLSPLEWMSPISDNDDMDHTAPASSEKIRKFFRGIGARQVRLVCGMILFAYLISHFLNHALGNISLDALAEGIYYHTLFWQFLPVAIVFYTAAFLHSCLGIWALYQRRQFKWKALEISTVLTIAWIHGCIGLYFWLRMKAWFRRAAPYLLATAVLVPTLALLGFYQGGRTVIADSRDPAWTANNLGEQQVGTAAQNETLDVIVNYFLAGYLGLIGIAV